MSFFWMDECNNCIHAPALYGEINVSSDLKNIMTWLARGSHYSTYDMESLSLFEKTLYILKIVIEYPTLFMGLFF